MQIRLATAADAPDITPLVKQYWAVERITGFDPTRVRRQLDQLLSNPTLGAGWIACADARIVGYLLASNVFSLEHGGMMAEIDEFFVTPRHRSTGVGSLLLNAAQRHLVTAGSARLQLQLNVDNVRGRQFYLRNGFEPRPGYELYEKPL